MSSMASSGSCALEHLGVICPICLVRTPPATTASFVGGGLESPPWAQVQRAAGSAGEMNLGTISDRSPKGRIVQDRYMLFAARLAVREGSPLSPSTPFCRFASALIRLASTAKPSPPTSPLSMQRRKMVRTAAAADRCRGSGHAGPWRKSNDRARHHRAQGGRTSGMPG